MISRFIRAALARSLVLPGAVFLASVGFSPVVCATPKIPIELEETREEISLLNLLRGLYLSKNQIQKLLPLARKAQAIKETAIAPFLARKQQVLKTFSTLRDSLYSTPGAEKEAQGQAGKLDREMKEAVGTAQDRIAALEKDVDDILTDAQACIIADFKPCLIPPKDLRNPVRVGQANDAPGILGKITDLIHSAPETLWNERGKILLDKISARLEEESGAMSATFKADARKRFTEIAARIRGTSDVDYAVKRGDLANELLLIDSRKALKHGHRKVGMNARWLLSDTAVRVLPRWLETMDRLTLPQAQEPDDDMILRLDQKDISARTLIQLKKLYNNRIKTGALPSYDAFVKPVLIGISRNDGLSFLNGVLDCARQLVKARPDTDAVRLLTRLARGYATWLELPLLNPNQDPYGLAADLQAAGQNPDATQACAKLLKLVELLKSFRKS